MIAQALRAFLLATFAWLAGLALAVVVGFALGLSFAGPVGIVSGGMIVGAAVGAAQRRVMRRKDVRLVVVTSLATPAAFLASAFVGAHLQVPGLTALTGPLVLLAQASAGLGGGNRPRMSGGSSLGAAMGWGMAVGALVVPGVPVAVRAMGLFVPGMMAATYVVLSRPSRERTRDARDSDPSMRTRAATA